MNGHPFTVAVAAEVIVVIAIFVLAAALTNGAAIVGFVN